MFEDFDFSDSSFEDNFEPRIEEPETDKEFGTDEELNKESQLFGDENSESRYWEANENTSPWQTEEDDCIAFDSSEYDSWQNEEDDSSAFYSSEYENDCDEQHKEEEGEHSNEKMKVRKQLGVNGVSFRGIGRCLSCGCQEYEDASDDKCRNCGHDRSRHW